VRIPAKLLSLFICRFCHMRGMRSAICYLTDKKSNLMTKHDILQFLQKEVKLSKSSASRDLGCAIKNGWLEVDIDNIIRAGRSVTEFVKHSNAKVDC